MRRVVHRVVFLFCLSTLFLTVFVQGAQRAPVSSVVANEGSARLVLNGKSSVFSMELSANVPKSLPATFDAKILAPDDKVLAEASVPVQISSVENKRHTNARQPVTSRSPTEVSIPLLRQIYLCSFASVRPTYQLCAKMLLG